MFETGVNTLKNIFSFTHLLGMLKYRHPYLASRCDSSDELLTQMGVRLIAKIQNPTELKYLLSEKNQDGETVLDLITFQEKIDVFMM